MNPLLADRAKMKTPLTSKNRRVNTAVPDFIITAM